MTIDEALRHIDLKLAERRRALVWEMFLDGLDAADIAAVMHRQRATDDEWRAQVSKNMRADLAWADPRTANLRALHEGASEPIGKIEK